MHRHPLTVDRASPTASTTLGGGAWEIIDYKTGRVPSKKELEGLVAPQLLLEAAMAERTVASRMMKGKAKERETEPTGSANGLGEGGEIRRKSRSAEDLDARRWSLW